MAQPRPNVPTESDGTDQVAPTTGQPAGPPANPPPFAAGEVGWHVLKALVRETSLLAAMRAMRERLGPVFRITLPTFAPVVVSGTDANRRVLVTERDAFRWRNETDPVTALLRHGILVEDGEAHAALRAAMEPSLAPRRVAGEAAAMWRATDAVLDGWRPGRTLDMIVEVRRVALLILMRSLFGIDFRADMPRLWRPILRSIAFIAPGAWIVWPGIPRPGFKRPLRRLDDYLHAIIRQRRAEGAAGDDLLSTLVRSGMADDLIRDQLLTMLIAGHDTSTALLAWTLHLLGEHPDVLARAQAEAVAVLGDGPPTVEQLERLRTIDQVVKESLRLFPPIHAGNRGARCPVELGGYDVPEGSRVMLSIYLTHRDPDLWRDPDIFDPSRFDRASQPPPAFAYLPFGGGQRNCIGAHFANVESRIVLGRILQRFDLTPRNRRRVRARMGATLMPSAVRMRVAPRAAAR